MCSACKVAFTVLHAAVPAGCAVLVERGGCTFLEKARAVQAANASKLIAYNDDEGAQFWIFPLQLQDTVGVAGCLANWFPAHSCSAGVVAGCFQMGVNGSATLERLNISSISVARSTGEQMVLKIAEGATVAIWLPRSDRNLQT